VKVVFSEMYFYDLKHTQPPPPHPKPFGVPNQILRDIVSEMFKTPKARIFPEKKKLGLMQFADMLNLINSSERPREIQSFHNL
jgi:hypothetical protein